MNNRPLPERGEQVLVRCETVHGFREVWATPAESVDGLVVYPTTTLAEDGPCWTVTHVRSGHAVLVALDTAALAFEAANALGALTDWTQPGDVVVAAMRGRLPARWQPYAPRGPKQPGHPRLTV